MALIKSKSTKAEAKEIKFKVDLDKPHTVVAFLSSPGSGAFQLFAHTLPNHESAELFEQALRNDGKVKTFIRSTKILPS